MLARVKTDRQDRVANITCSCGGRLVREVADSRPRVDYRLPDGRVVAIIFDHGDELPEATTFQLLGGKVVTATRCGSARSVTPEFVCDRCHLVVSARSVWLAINARVVH